MELLYGFIGLFVGALAGVLVMAMVIAGARADEMQEKIFDTYAQYTPASPDGKRPGIFCETVRDPKTYNERLKTETLYTREDNLLTVRILKLLPEKRVHLEVVLSMIAHFKPDDTFSLRYDDFKKRYNKRHRELTCG